MAGYFFSPQNRNNKYRKKLLLCSIFIVSEAICVLRYVFICSTLLGCDSYSAFSVSTSNYTIIAVIEVVLVDRTVRAEQVISKLFAYRKLLCVEVYKRRSLAYFLYNIFHPFWQIRVSVWSKNKGAGKGEGRAWIHHRSKPSSCVNCCVFKLLTYSHWYDTLCDISSRPALADGKFGTIISILAIEKKSSINVRLT